MTDHEQHETEAQPNLKEEIADYLSEYHGGRDTDLNAIEAAEHIVSKLAEPHIRAKVAQEILERLPETGPHINMTQYREGTLDGMNRAARIAKGPQQ